MGRPFDDELDALERTYDWARSQQLGSLADQLAGMSSLGLLAVGSGGSLTAAHVAAGLHSRYCGRVARAVSPLVFRDTPFAPKETAALILSAGGQNRDITFALRHAATHEPRHCAVLCLREESALVKSARRFSFVHVSSALPPIPKDGFLATNSLLALIVLLHRAFATAYRSRDDLPLRLYDLLAIGGKARQWLQNLARSTAPVWQRETLLLVYSPILEPAAVDVESKFSEGALGTIQIADIRNFAHGRHNWIAKRTRTTGVVALGAAPDLPLIQATLNLIPKGVPRVLLPVTKAPFDLAGVLAALHLVQAAGHARGIDPGRPKVPLFGRRIYRLRLTSPAAPTIREAAITRKRHARGYSPSPLSADDWNRSYKRYVSKLGATRFGAIALDYDGTLCDGPDRLSMLSPKVSNGLRRLLAAGVRIGIATGRGHSVAPPLRQALAEQTWHLVTVGYHNCSEISALGPASPTDDAPPEPVEAIALAARRLLQDQRLAAAATVAVGHLQISLRPHSAVDLPALLTTANDLAREFVGLKVLTSNHSVDILSSYVSKRNLVSALEDSTRLPVLPIGDRGAWPGNDVELLSHPHALSVHEVSGEPSLCWNLAPPGHRGVQALIGYLRRIQPRKGSFTIDTDGLDA